VLAGFGAFPLLAGGALAAGYARKRKPEPAGDTSSPSAPACPGNSDPADGHRHTGFNNQG
jgi:hypothetical protein